ncbi:UNVERIFIED_CONTAM: ethionine resistance protein [Gekko kuhli]
MYGSARSVGKIEPSNQSPGRSPRLPRSPRLGHRRTNSTGGSSGSSAGGGSGKTLSMENIQSLNAAYATSGPMYLSDHENVGADTPKSTMTLGRSGGRLPYGVRMTAMGSSPNIASSGVASDTIAFGEHHLPPVSMASTVPHSLRQARDNTIMDLQTQLKEVLRENDILRKDVEVKESKLSSSMNSIKTFWSPELKKERALRKDEASKITIWKEQYRVVQEENQSSYSSPTELSRIRHGHRCCHEPNFITDIVWFMSQGSCIPPAMNLPQNFMVSTEVRAVCVGFLCGSHAGADHLIIKATGEMDYCSSGNTNSDLQTKMALVGPRGVEESVKDAGLGVEGDEGEVEEQYPL